MIAPSIQLVGSPGLAQRATTAAKDVSTGSRTAVPPAAATATA